MFPSFPYFSSFAALKDALPSTPKTIQKELSYRKACVAIILSCRGLACGDGSTLHHATLHKAVVLMHRFFTRCSSNDWKQMHKWAVAAACVFLATKIDSAYIRVENVAHHTYRQMKDLYNKGKYDAEYFNPDGTPGNPKFLSYLCHLVCQAESRILLAVNFDFNIEVASSMAVYQLKELGLTVERSAQDPAVSAVRKDVYSLAKTSLEACSADAASKCVSFLLYNAREIALACIWKACRCHGVPLDWHNISDRCYVPDLTEERLAAIEKHLPRLKGDLSRAATPAVSGGASSQLQDQQQQHQDMQVANAAADGAAAVPAAADEEHAIPAPNNGKTGTRHDQPAAAAAVGNGKAGKHALGGSLAGTSLGDGSQVDATTVGPRVSRSPISPDSQTGPAVYAAAGAARANSSGTAEQRQSRKRVREEGLAGMLVAPERSGRLAVA